MQNPVKYGFAIAPEDLYESLPTRKLQLTVRLRIWLVLLKVKGSIIKF